MDPFEKDGLHWNVFAWRINGNLKKYCKGAQIMSNDQAYAIVAKEFGKQLQ